MSLQATKLSSVLSAKTHAATIEPWPCPTNRTNVGGRERLEEGRSTYTLNEGYGHEPGTRQKIADGCGRFRELTSPLSAAAAAMIVGPLQMSVATGALPLVLPLPQKMNKTFQRSSTSASSLGQRPGYYFHMDGA